MKTLHLNNMGWNYESTLSKHRYSLLLFVTHPPAILLLGMWQPAHVDFWSWLKLDWAGDRCESPLPTPPSALSASHTLWGDPGDRNWKGTPWEQGPGCGISSFLMIRNNGPCVDDTKTIKMTLSTLFKTLLTSVANSLEQTSKWNIFPQFETQAPRSCKDIRTNSTSNPLLQQVQLVVNTQR